MMILSAHAKAQNVLSSYRLPSSRLVASPTDRPTDAILLRPREATFCFVKTTVIGPKTLIKNYSCRNCLFESFGSFCLGRSWATSEVDGPRVPRFCLIVYLKDSIEFQSRGR